MFHTRTTKTSSGATAVQVVRYENRTMDREDLQTALSTALSPKIDNHVIVKHYHSLWHVEQAFRIARRDLEMRPIYHFKEQAIKAHVLICFMALAVSKYMEIKTGKSLKHIIKSLKNVTDARILNTLTEQEIVLRSEIPDGTICLLRKIGVWY